MATTTTATTTANATTPNLVVNRKTSWLKRSIVNRLTSNIQSMVDTTMEASHFLQRHEEESNDVLSLHRDSIQVGALLGRGSFSVAHEVEGLRSITGEEEGDDDSTITSCSSMIRGRFAIKMLRPDLVQKPDVFQAAAADLLLEAKYLAALDHPGILKLRGVAQGGVSAYQAFKGGFFLIVDRLDCTLKDKITEWRVLEKSCQEDLYDHHQTNLSLLDCLSPTPSEETSNFLPMMDDLLQATQTSIQLHLHTLREQLLLEKLDIACQLASALAYLHEQRLIFRDLKPCNVGITADNKVQLFDFGFCRELPTSEIGSGEPTEEEEEDAHHDEEQEVLHCMSGKGSLMYMAPEVLRDCRYNQKADCYSFAMVLYELLTLNKPFPAMDSLKEFQDMLCYTKARPLLGYTDIPQDLQKLLEQSWDDSVKDRWTMNQIHTRLQDILAQQLEAYENKAQESEEAQEQSQQEETSFASAAARGVSCTKGGGVVLDLIADLFGAKFSAAEEEARHQEFSPEVEKWCQASSNTDTTEATEASTYAGDETDHDDDDQSFTVTAMTATEEPVEVTMEQARESWRGTEEEEEEEDELWDTEAPCTGEEKDIRICSSSSSLHMITRNTSAPLVQEEETSLRKAGRCLKRQCSI